MASSSQIPRFSALTRHAKSTKKSNFKSQLNVDYILSSTLPRKKVNNESQLKGNYIKHLDKSQHSKSLLILTLKSRHKANLHEGTLKAAYIKAGF